jgi:hypothetical protein
MLLIALVGGGTWALANEMSGEVVQVCVDRESGLVRVVGTSDECSKKETPLAWNIQGPVGPQGPQGEPGVLGFYTRHNLGGSCPSGYNCPALAICDEGDVVTGGGFEHSGTLGQQVISVISSYPTADYIWQVTIGNYSGEDIEFRAYARCADLTPSAGIPVAPAGG